MSDMMPHDGVRSTGTEQRGVGARLTPYVLGVGAALMLAEITALVLVILQPGDPYPDVSTWNWILLVAAMLVAPVATLASGRDALFATGALTGIAAANLVDAALRATPNASLGIVLAAIGTTLLSVLCWLRGLVRAEPPASGAGHLVRAGLAAAVVAAITAGVGTWFSGDLTGRFVDHRTASTAAPTNRPLPDRPGRVLWSPRLKSGGSDITSDQIDAAAGEVLVWRGVGDMRGVVAYDAVSGRVRWQYLRRDLLISRLGVDAADHVAGLRVGDGAVGLDLASGRVRWRNSEIPSASSYDLYGRFIVSDGPNGRATAIDAATGRVLWTSHEGPAGCRDSPPDPLGATRTRLVLTWRCRTSGHHNDQVIEAVDRTGRTAWSVRDPHQDPRLPQSAGVGNVLVYNAFYEHSGQKLSTAYDMAGGKVLWQHNDDRPNQLGASDDRLIELGDRQVQALDPRTGRVIWSTRTDESSVSTGFVASAADLYLYGVPFADRTSGPRMHTTVRTLAARTGRGVGSAAVWLPAPGCGAGRYCDTFLSGQVTAGAVLLVPRDLEHGQPVVLGNGGSFTPS